MRSVYRIRYYDTVRYCCFGCVMDVPDNEWADLSFIFLLTEDQAAPHLEKGTQCPRCHADSGERVPWPANGESVRAWQKSVRTKLIRKHEP